MTGLILKYELKKIFRKRINLIILIVLFLLAVILSCLAIGSMRYRDSEGTLYTGVTAGRKLADDRNRWKGELTPEKIQEIVRNVQELAQEYPEGIPDTEYGKIAQSYDDITNFIINVLTPDTDYDESVLYQLTEKTVGVLYTTYKENLQKMIQEYGDTKEKQEFLGKQYESIEMPLTYAAKDAWDNMAMYAQTYGIILAVVIGFLASGIFVDEFRTKAEAVFFSAKYGRTKATSNKLAAGVLMTTGVYWSGMAVLSLISFGIMGTSGFLTPYQIDQPYSIYSMTYGEYYLLILICGYIASLLAAAITMLVTAKMHTANLAVCIPFFLYCMLPFIGRALPSLETFFNIMPSVFMNIIEYAKTPIVFQIGNNVIRQIPLVMSIYAILSTVLFPLVYRSYSRYGLRRTNS